MAVSLWCTHKEELVGEFSAVMNLIRQCSRLKYKGFVVKVGSNCLCQRFLVPALEVNEVKAGQAARDVSFHRGERTEM